MRVRCATCTTSQRVLETRHASGGGSSDVNCSRDSGAPLRLTVRASGPPTDPPAPPPPPPPRLALGGVARSNTLGNDHTSRARSRASLNEPSRPGGGKTLGGASVCGGSLSALATWRCSVATDCTNWRHTRGERPSACAHCMSERRMQTNPLACCASAPSSPSSSASAMPSS
eukprot:scaffold14658_cov67-Phaeocystis_antarctica.AAC.18